jgi:tetratricopeptide (TPR) repeat protein
MKILTTLFAFLLLIAVNAAVAQSDADNAGGIGTPSTGSASLGIVRYVETPPAIIIPTKTSRELLAEDDSIRMVISMQMKNDSSKAAQYAQTALEYMHYDTVSNKKERLNYENQAISYTLKALHYYSRANDSIGLRTSFDNLAKVYRSQKKYPQAKWFVLQSNTLSRVKNDVPNVITSLLALAAIKSEIKDYDLALRDLNEAMKLADSSHAPKTAATVQFGYVMLYNNMKNYTKADIALKKYNFINDSIRRGQDAKLAAAVDSVQRKKKLYLTNSKRLSKTSSIKKTTLL